MWRKSSITAEQKKQPAPTHKMGQIPKAPNSAPPRAGPNSPESVLTMLITALAWVSRSGPVSSGILA